MSTNPREIEQRKEPLRIVPQPKPVVNDKVELIKVRRELLTLASRIEKIVKGQETA